MQAYWVFASVGTNFEASVCFTRFACLIRLRESYFEFASDIYNLSKSAAIYMLNFFPFYYVHSWQMLTLQPMSTEAGLKRQLWGR